MRRLAIAWAVAMVIVPTARVALGSGASPVNGGCYIAAPGECRIHIDPVHAAVNFSESLVHAQVKANNAVVYDFRTDVSNPPTGNYSPTTPALDFAAQCGVSYTIAWLTQDTGEPSLGIAGSTGTVTCPAAVP